MGMGAGRHQGIEAHRLEAEQDRQEAGRAGGPDEAGRMAARRNGRQVGPVRATLVAALAAVILAGCGGGSDSQAGAQGHVDGGDELAVADRGVWPEPGSSPTTTDIDPPVPASGTSVDVDAIRARLQDTTAVDPLASSPPPTQGVTTKDAPATIPANASVGGAWSPSRRWPLIAIHAALLPDGRVMSFGTTETGKQTGLFNYDVWDAAAARVDEGHMTLPNGTSTDLFCSAQTLLPDSGKLFIAGGDRYVNGATTNTANPNTTQFDYQSNTLTRGPDMRRPRWYSSTLAMPDGRIYIQGGSSGTDYAEMRNLDNSQSLLSASSTSELDYWYPRNFVASDGRVFGIDVAGRMYFMDTADTGYLERAGNVVSDFMGAGSSAVLYAPGEVLQIGGNSPRSAKVDFRGPLPVVTETARLSSKRYWVTGTVLPDGKVLATGGSAVDNQLNGVNNSAELWNPATGTWTVGNAGALARLYHSVALLLPDATVLVGGGGAPGPLVNTNAEIYYPPYLFTTNGQFASRPALTQAPTALTPGQAFSVTVQSSTTPSKLVLIRNGSVTHSTNFDQRRIELPMSMAGNVIQTRLPASGATVPPGFYLLFVLDQAGVPSVARSVRVNTGRPVDIEVNWTGRLGGAGGSAFELACPVGQVLAGVSGYADTTQVRQVAPRCVAVTATGAWSGTPTERGSAGAVGGTAFSRTCPSGSAVVGMRGRAGTTLGQLVLSCRPLATPGRVSGVALEQPAIGNSGATVRNYRSCGGDNPAYALYGRSGSAIDSFGLLCRGDSNGSSANAAPVISTPANQIGNIGDPVTLAILASDPDGNALTFSATGLPAGLAINATSGLITGSPTAAGTSTVTVRVSDGRLDASANFTWQIRQTVNSPPVIQSPGTLTQVVGASVNVAITGSDPEGQPLTWSATGLPAGLSIHPTTGVISGTASLISNWWVTVTASDGTNSASTSFAWSITAPQSPPADICNRLVNPGFESGLAGWEISASAALVSDARSGTQALRFSGGWVGAQASVDAGTAYNVTVNYKATGTSGWLGLGVTFLDASGNRIRDISIDLPNAATYREQTFPLTTPTGAIGLRVWVLAEGNRTATLDDLSLRSPACTDGGSDTCNKVGNGSFESGLVGWTISGQVQTVASTRHGSAAAQVRGLGAVTSVPFAATAGRRYTGSVDYRNTGGTDWVGFGVHFLDAGGGMIGQTAVPLAVSSDWSRALLDVTAPAGTVAMRAWVYAEGQQLVVADGLRIQEVGCGQTGVDTCNRLSNVGFDNGLANWDPLGTFALVAEGRSGGPAARIGASNLAGPTGSIGQVIAVTPGTSLTLSAWYTAEGAGWAGMGLHYLDSSGDWFSQVGVTLADRTNFGQTSLTVTPPVGSVAVRVWVYTEDGRVVVVDDLDLRVTGCTGGAP